MAEHLDLQVAPHIVEDLGLNLYTDLPRVLVEFIANAHDADASECRVAMDESRIDRARKVMRQQYKLELEQLKAGELKAEPPSLTHRELPEEHVIEITDNGTGMSENDLQKKFLVAGRRRRQEESNGKHPRTKKKRLIMGRKGLARQRYELSSLTFAFCRLR